MKFNCFQLHTHGTEMWLCINNCDSFCTNRIAYYPQYISVSGSKLTVQGIKLWISWVHWALPNELPTKTGFTCSSKVDILDYTRYSGDVQKNQLCWSEWSMKCCIPIHKQLNLSIVPILAKGISHSHQASRDWEWHHKVSKHSKTQPMMSGIGHLHTWALQSTQKYSS